MLGANTIYALKNISLKVAAGELLAIVGASGSGKSTLMNILGFLDKGTQGDYFFQQQNIINFKETKLSELRNHYVGFIFQAFFLLPRLTALQNVMLPLHYRDVELKYAKEKALFFLAKVGMGAYKNHRPNQLSGGQQQRIAIARALVGEPALILADEPTGALDSKTGGEVLELFFKLNQNANCTIIIVTHDPYVSRQCPRVITLSDGQVLMT
jgi:putative ABC transport system ATP-binding protein